MVQTAMLGGIALPFAVALALTGAAWALGLRRHGVAAAIGVAAGFLAGLPAVVGWPSVPPVGAVEKLPWLALLGIAAGLGITRVAGLRGRMTVAAGAVALAVVWLGWPRLAIPDPRAWLVALAVVAAATWLLTRAAEDGRRAHAGLFMVATVTAAIVGFYGSSYAMAQLVGVLAAGMAGALAAVGWTPRGMGAVSHAAAALPLVGLVAMLAFYTRAEPLALLLLVPVLAADSVRAALLGAAWPRRGPGPLSPAAVRHAATAGFALAPAGVAVLIAVARSGPLYM